MREYSSVIAIIVAIFLITLTGAYFSASFTEHKSYMELFILFGALLFTFSILVILIFVGSRSFVLFLTLFAAITMVVLGVWATFIMTILTYVAWGFVFSVELLLLQNGVPSAIEWFKSHYDFASFRVEYYAFLPILWLFYFLLEVIPYYLLKETMLEFKPKKILHYMKELLKET